MAKTCETRLVLTRRIGEALVIADTITITMLDYRRGQIRIGVVAPGDVNIRRAELEKTK